MHRGLAIGLMLAGCGLWATAAAAQASDEPAAIGTQIAAESAAVAAESMETSSAEAPATSEDTSSDGWNVSFTPYLWVAGTSGEIGVPQDGEEIEIDKSFADVLGSLKFAFMGALDVNRDRFVMISDLMYLSVSAKAESIRDPAFLSGKVDASVLLASAAAGYRLVDKGPLFLDVFLGGRVFALDVDLKLSGPQNTYSASKSPTNVSPFIGSRVRLPVGEKWALGLYGDVGGLVNDTDVKWQLLGTVQYDISSHWRMVAGYRYMSVHHKKRDLDFDVNLSGPILGFTYKF